MRRSDAWNFSSEFLGRLEATPFQAARQPRLSPIPLTWLLFPTPAPADRFKQRSGASHIYPQLPFTREKGMLDRFPGIVPFRFESPSSAYWAAIAGFNPPVFDFKLGGGVHQCGRPVCDRLRALIEQRGFSISMPCSCFCVSGRLTSAQLISCPLHGREISGSGRKPLR